MSIIAKAKRWKKKKTNASEKEAWVHIKPCYIQMCSSVAEQCTQPSWESSRAVNATGPCKYDAALDKMFGVCTTHLASIEATEMWHDGRGVGVYAGKPGQPSHGELLFSVLLEFWLTDGEDPALRDPKDSRLAPPLPYEAPTPDLLAALQVRTPGPCLTVCALAWTMLCNPWCGILMGSTPRTCGSYTNP